MNRHAQWVTFATAISLLSKAAAGAPADVPSLPGTLVVSPADPETIYRGLRNLSVSHDAGQTWERVGPLPGTVNDLAASGRNRDILYAATAAGLLISRDGGHSWTSLIAGKPATIVEVTPEGFIYAYLIQRGLVRSAEQPLRFSHHDGDGFLFYLAVDPAGTSRFVRDDR